MANFVEESYDEESSEENSSDEELREAFKKGIIKPGLNVQVLPAKTFANNIPRMKEKLDNMILELPWIERLDMTNDLAPIAPEMALQIERHEQKRENEFKGNKKIPFVAPAHDPVLNDFKREILFYRQAQTAVKDGIIKLKEHGVSTKRPDDYFAEMAKSDEHMQKIRKHLTAKQEGQQKSERIKQLREQRKMSKIIQREAEEKKQADKTKMLKDLKAYRKGKLKSLDFLDDDKKKGQKGRPKPNKKRQERDKKFGFGGKKKGSKRNTKDSASDTRDFSAKRNRAGVGAKALYKQKGGNKNKNNKSNRPGKNRRVKSKN